MYRPTVDHTTAPCRLGAGLVPLIYVAASDWTSLPSSPSPASVRHSSDRRGGGDVRSKHHTVTDGTVR